MATASDPGVLVAVARLQRLAQRLPELGEHGDWLAQVLNRYLDPHARVSLEEAAGISARDGDDHWRMVAKRELRDQALRELATVACPCLNVSRQADEIRQLVRRYETTRWRRADRHKPRMPVGYHGTPDAFLFAALFHGGGEIPLGHSTLREILSACHPERKSAGDETDLNGDGPPYTEQMELISPTQVAELLAETPVFKTALAERDAAVLRRRGLIGEICKIERQAERDYPKLAAAVENAIALVKEREAALWAARQAYDVAAAAKSTASFRYTRERDALEAELRASANPTIDAFVHEMRDALDATRKAFSYAERIERNDVTGKSRHVVVNNLESVRARAAAINIAIERAQEIPLTEPDQSSVPGQLEKLRAGLPAVSPFFVAEA